MISTFSAATESASHVRFHSPACLCLQYKAADSCWIRPARTAPWLWCPRSPGAFLSSWTLSESFCCWWCCSGLNSIDWCAPPNSLFQLLVWVIHYHHIIRRCHLQFWWRRGRPLDLPFEGLIVERFLWSMVCSCLRSGCPKSCCIGRCCISWAWSRSLSHTCPAGGCGSSCCRDTTRRWSSFS